MEGFVCIITGCSSLTGIGRASTYAIAKKNPKAIYVTDIVSDHLQELADEITKTTGVECIPRQLDAASDEAISLVIIHALENYGRLDVFFANAGIVGSRSLFKTELEDFMNIMRINAWSVFAAIKHSAVAMEKTSDTKLKSGGSIIATASIAGLRSGAGPIGYSASKAAVINICQSSAWRLKGKNIRVNAICPGVIETEMTRRALGAANEQTESTKALERMNPLNRCGHSEEIANMVAFLASEEASYVNGQHIVVDGGVSSSHPHIPFFADN